MFKKPYKQRESYADNFFAFLIAFEWGRMFKRGIDKWEVKFHAKLRSN